MAKRKYSEVEMIGALKQMEAGRSAAEVGRELGGSKHTVYAWKAKYGGMTVGEAQRLRQLEDENGRLKKLVADLSLDKEMLKAVIEKTGGARRTQGGSALAVEQVSGEPAADLRAVERGGVEPAVCEPEERRRVARELAGSGAGEAEVGIPALAVEAGRKRPAREPQESVSRVPGSGAADPEEEEKTVAASGYFETGGDESEPGVGIGFCA